MFNWFWRFLYSISNILFQVIDGLFKIANMLCGIEPIKTKAGTQTDFLSYLIESDRIFYGFIGCAVVGLFLIMIFSVFAILKTMKGEIQTTPAQVAVKVIKTLGIFLFVPSVMIIFTKLVNELMKVLYTATSMGGATMGEFLFEAFLPTDLTLNGSFVDWTDVYSVESFMDGHGYDLSDYKFFFSWLCCLPLLFKLAMSLMNFVERTISIVLLFIVSPLSISSTVIDDGSHFKLWREQVLIKYLVGYGMIIGLNVYILVVSLICSGDLVFFENTFLNFLFKIAFIIGGAVTLDRTMGLVGNLVSSGAGDAAVDASGKAFEGFKGAVKSGYQIAKGVAKAPISLANKINDIRKEGVKETLAKAVGYKTDKQRMKEGWKPQGHKTTEDKILDAIMGLAGVKKDDQKQNQKPNMGGGEENNEEDSNSNNNKLKEMKNNPIVKAITGMAGIKTGDDDDVY